MKAKNVRKRSIGWVIKAMLLLGFIGAVYVANTYFQLISWPERVSYPFLWLAAVAQLVFWVVTAFVWSVVLKETTGKEIPIWDSFAQIVLVLIGKYLPGKIWGVAARSQQLTRFGLPHRRGLVAAYLEQAISIHAGMAMGLFAWLEAIGYPGRWLVYLLIFLSLVVASCYHAPLLSMGFRWLSGKYPSVAEAIELADLPARSYLKLFLLYLVEWLFIGVILICLYAAVFGNAAPSFRLIMLMLGSNAIGMIVGFIAFFSPGGIGVREGMMVGLLVTELPLAEATFLVICYRLWLIVADAIAGVVIFTVYKHPIEEPDRLS